MRRIHQTLLFLVATILIGLPAYAQVDNSDAAKSEASAADAANKAGLSSRDFFARGKAAYDGNQFEEAADLFRQAMQNDPKSDIIAANYARALNAAKRYDEAAVAYRKAIELKPLDNANYHVNLGMALSGANKSDEAIEAFKKAAEVSPAMGGLSYNNIGIIFLKSGRESEATAAFKKSIALDPKFADSYYQLAVTKFGDTATIPEAVPLLREYLKLAPTGEYAAGAKGLLEAAGALK